MVSTKHIFSLHYKLPQHSNKMFTALSCGTTNTDAYKLTATNTEHPVVPPKA